MAKPHATRHPRNDSRNGGVLFKPRVTLYHRPMNPGKSRRIAAILMLLIAGTGFSPAVESAASPPLAIKHIVIIMQENHGFDNYFGWYRGAEGLGSTPSTVAAKLFHASNNSFDPCHTVNCMARYYNGGKMDGFSYYGYFAASDISYYWHLAAQGVLFDNDFSA